MPRLEKFHRVRHCATNMYDLVCDVEKYPEFVPLCKSLHIQKRREKGVKSVLVADMTMAYKVLNETFTTQVIMNRETLAIDVKYIDGPFRHLDNEWRFEPNSDKGCNIRFMIDYELKNRMLSIAASAVFDTAFKRFVSAFEQRADRVYTPKV